MPWFRGTTESLVTILLPVADVFTFSSPWTAAITAFRGEIIFLVDMLISFADFEDLGRVLRSTEPVLIDIFIFCDSGTIWLGLDIGTSEGRRWFMGPETPDTEIAVRSPELPDEWFSRRTEGLWLLVEGWIGVDAKVGLDWVGAGAKVGQCWAGREGTVGRGCVEEDGVGQGWVGEEGLRRGFLQIADQGAAEINLKHNGH